MQNTYSKKSFMIDLARKRSFNRNEIRTLIETLSRCGYNGIGLYIEGFFEFPKFKGSVRNGCMTKDDAAFVCECAYKQFESKESYEQLLNEVKSDFIAFSSLYPSFIASLSNAIKGTGHTQNDIAELETTQELVITLAKKLDSYNTERQENAGTKCIIKLPLE